MRKWIDVNCVESRADCVDSVYYLDYVDSKDLVCTLMDNSGMK